MNIITEYKIVDIKNGEVVGVFSDEADAILKASEINNASNGYKYVVEPVL